MADLKKIQAQLEKLIGDANQATGNTRTNITDGVEDLISGYGQSGSGITPSGTISITENGTYDVTEYASANVAIESDGLSEEEVQARIDEAFAAIPNAEEASF